MWFVTVYVFEIETTCETVTINFIKPALLKKNSLVNQIINSGMLGF